MEDKKDGSVPVREQGFLKVKVTTAMIFAGIIFLVSLFSGWLTNTKDLDVLRASQKEEALKIENHSGRITAMEQCILGLKEDTKEMKTDLKEIRQDQKDFYKKAGKSMGIN